MKLSENEIALQGLVKDLLETRDMCGNETATIKQWEADNGRKLNPFEQQQVRNALEMAWKGGQRRAGVRLPLSCEDRADAYAAIQNSRA